ncbi:ATP-binding cassette domain-containing protein [Lactobacillus xylocopicola]|uniref:ABC transporter ATP-binding protein n=1 Tax=Lactobacillus xylocopicola TaxID=2976676 RepID=A0ABM8BIQ6_9LACO|nr:ABC transporter ATP-binding protein [Lactobacillus xylocopicola]BDR60992.1 ABC transporter ATP-binding protein [Lactobacillus xylocopicola]
MSLKGILKNNPLRAAVVMATYVAYALASTISMYLFKYAINDLTANKWSRFVFWLLIMAAGGLLAVLLHALATYLYSKQVQDYFHQVRRQIMHHYYAQGTTKVAAMQNQLGNNLKVLTDDYAMPLLQVWQNLLSVTMTTTALFTLHWSLIAATAVVVVIVLLLPKIIEKQMGQASIAATKKNAKMLDTVKNWFAGLSELRRYKSGKRLNQEIDQSSQALAQANIAKKRYEGVSIGINGLGNAIGQIGIAFWGGILYFNRQVSLGDWSVGAEFTSTIFNGLWSIISALTRIKSTKKLRQEIEELIVPVADEQQSTNVCGVTGKNLVVKYDNGETIAYPDFNVNRGDKVLLVGDSGTGKSTLFKVMLGQITPASGELAFTDEAGRKVAPQEAHLGYIAQDASLFPDTIINNITMFSQKLANRVDQTVEKVGLVPDLAKFASHGETVIDLDQNNLSGGQKQKIVLARAEIHNTQFLLLDEATSAIDSQTTNAIVCELLNMDATVILIAHNFSPELVSRFDYQIHLKADNKEGEKDVN